MSVPRHVMLPLLVCFECWVMWPLFVFNAMWFFWAFIYMSLRYVVMPCCTTHTCMICVRVTCIAMCGIWQPSCLFLVASLMGKCHLVLPLSHGSLLLLQNTLRWTACVLLRSSIYPIGEMSRVVPLSPCSLLWLGFIRWWPTHSFLGHVCLFL